MTSAFSLRCINARMIHSTESLKYNLNKPCKILTVFSGILNYLAFAKIGHVNVDDIGVLPNCFNC